MTVIQKITRPEQRHLQNLRARAQGTLSRALEAFLATTRSDATLRRIIELLDAGDSAGVINLINSHINVLGNSVPRAFTEAAQGEADHVVQQIVQHFPEAAAVGFGFDPSYERAARLMERQRLDFIQGFSQGQIDHTRQVLAQALRDGEGPIGAARRIRDSMGLTRTQAQWVENYEMMLRGGPRTSVYMDALERDARDRRFDRTLERHRREQIPLSEDQIARMKQRYRERLTAYRSEVIARTETQAVLGMARHEAQEQIHTQAGIPDAWIKRYWRTSLDGRERNSHREANNQMVRGMNTRFLVGNSRMLHPGDRAGAPEEVINCRCDEEIEYDIPEGATLNF